MTTLLYIETLENMDIPRHYFRFHQQNDGYGGHSNKCMVYALWWGFLFGYYSLNMAIFFTNTNLWKTLNKPSYATNKLS